MFVQFIEDVYGELKQGYCVWFVPVESRGYLEARQTMAARDCRPGGDALISVSVGLASAASSSRRWGEE